MDIKQTFILAIKNKAVVRVRYENESKGLFDRVITPYVIGKKQRKDGSIREYIEGWETSPENHFVNLRLEGCHSIEILLTETASEPNKLPDKNRWVETFATWS